MCFFKTLGWHKLEELTFQCYPALPIQPTYLKIGPTWPNRQCCLADSSKTAPRILIFSIAMDADNSFYVKSIATFMPHIFQVHYFSLSHGGR
jgi:hypothetical protein